MQMLIFVITTPLLWITATVANECGTYKYHQNLIVNGEPVLDFRDWPWVVGLFQRDQITTKYKCGATLVSRSVVVTAAHCVEENEFTLDAKDITLVMGRTKVQNWQDHSTVQIRNAQNVKIHESYGVSRRIGSDLAFIELNFPITITDEVTPICLWDNETDHQITSQNGTVIGWGRDENDSSATEVAKMTELPIIDRDVCLASNQQIKHILIVNGYCAGNRDGTGPCTGDSGSGMFVLRSNEGGDKSWVLRGVVSRTLKPVDNRTGCDLNNYIIFTDMAKLKPWLTDTSCSFKHPITFGALNMTRLGDKYYYIEINLNKRLNWTSAQQFCRSHGLQLVSIETEEEKNLIVEYIEELPASNNEWWGWLFWLGGSYSQQEGTWRWTNGQKLNFTDWRPGKSDNDDEDCLLMVVWSDGSHRWWDIPCSERSSFVCELEDVCS